MKDRFYLFLTNEKPLKLMIMKKFFYCVCLFALFLFLGCSNENENISSDAGIVKVSAESSKAIADFINQLEGKITRSDQQSSLKRLLTDLWDCQGRNGNCIDDIIVKPDPKPTAESVLTKSSIAGRETVLWELSTEAVELENLVRNNKLIKNILRNENYPHKVFYKYQDVSSELELIIPVIVE